MAQMTLLPQGGFIRVDCQGPWPSAQRYFERDQR